MVPGTRVWPGWCGGRLFRREAEGRGEIGDGTIEFGCLFGFGAPHAAPTISDGPMPVGFEMVWVPLDDGGEVGDCLFVTVARNPGTPR